MLVGAIQLQAPVKICRELHEFPEIIHELINQ